MIEGIPSGLILSILCISRRNAPGGQTAIRLIKQLKLEVRGDVQGDATPPVLLIPVDFSLIVLP